MKIHNYLKKFLCLILSSVLLISNTQVFAQNNEIPRIMSPEVVSDLNKRVANLRQLLNQLEGKVKKANEFGGQKYMDMIKEMSKDVELIENEYKTLLGDLQLYRNNLEKIEGAISRDQNVAELLARKYYGSGYLVETHPGLEIVSEEYMRGALDFRAIAKEDLERISSEMKISNTVLPSSTYMEHRLDAIQRLRDEVTNLEIIKDDLTSGKRYNVFKRLEEISAKYSREEIWEIAFSHLTDKEKNAVNLIIKAGEEKSAYKIQKALNKFYAKFKGTGKIGPLATLKLSRTFKGLTAEQRMGMMETITELGPNESYLARSIVKKPGVSGKFVKMISPVMVVTVVLTAAFITEVNAQNAFPKFASITEKNKMKKAIENGEKVSTAALARWYMDPENASIIEKNKAHYWNQVAVLFSAAQASQDQEGILKVMNEMDPDPGLETAQVQEQTEKGFDAALGQYI